MTASFEHRLTLGAYWESHVALRFSEAGFCVIVTPNPGCWKDSVDLKVGCHGVWQDVEVKSNGPRIFNRKVLVAAERSFNNHAGLGATSLYANWVFTDRYGRIACLPRGCPIIRGGVVTDRARGLTYQVILADEAYLGDFQKLCNYIRKSASVSQDRGPVHRENSPGGTGGAG